MEFIKVSHFVDLEATGSEKEAFIKQVEEMIAKVKAVGDLEIKLTGAKGAKETLAAMNELTKKQEALIKQTKAYEKAVLDKAKADKLAADAAEKLSKAELNQAKAANQNVKTAQLQAKIQQQVTKEKEKVVKASAAEMKSQERLSNAYEQLKSKYTIAANTAKRLAAEELQVAAAHGLASNEYKEAAANTLLAQQAAQKYYLELVKIEDAVGQSQRKVGQYENATMSLTQVLREAPAFANSFQTGISGISNNLPILFDQFKILSTQVGSNAKAFGIMARSLFTFTGLLPIALLVVQLFSKQIGEFFSSIFGGAKAIDALKAKQEALNAAFKDSSYAEAVKNVNELRINIQLAKEGFLQKNLVLNQYNETLGNSIGKAKDLNEAEALLVKNGDAYIQMTLLKAAANAALEEAAQKAVEIQKKAATRGGLQNVDLRRDAFKNASKAEIKQYNDLAAAETEAILKNNQTVAAALTKQRQTLFESFVQRGADKDLKKDQNVLLGIAEDFQRRAAAIQGKFKLDFFGGQFDDKDKKDKKAKDLEDFKKDLQKEISEREKIQDDITRTRLEGESARLLANAQREREINIKRGESLEDFQRRQAAAFDEQLQDYVAYYNKVEELNKFNTQAEIRELERRTAEEKRAVNEKLQDKELTAAQRQDLQETLLQIDAKAAQEKALIVLKGNETALAFDRDYEAQVTDFTKQNLDDRIKARIEYFEKLKAQIQAELEFQNNSLTLLKTEELTGLNKQLRNQEISLEEYNKKKLAISRKFASEELDNQILAYQQLLTATAKTEEERRDIEAKIAELRLKKDDELTQKKIDNLQKLEAAQKRLGEEAFNTFQAIVAGSYEREKNAVQDLIDQLEIKKQKDIEVAEATAANAQEAADRVAVINARAASDREALVRRQRQIDQEKARFDKVANIAKIITDTASAVVEALPNVPLAVTVGAIGALQLARVLATPIPRYARGLDEADEDHFAFVGDGGRRELVRYPDGSSWITPDRPTLTLIPKGASVLPDIDKQAAAFSQLAPGFAQIPGDMGLGTVASAIRNEGKKTRAAILGKRETNIQIRNGVIDMKTKDGYNETNYINQNLGF